jgi:chromate transporter
MKNDLYKIFISCVRLSLFSFGGGVASISLIHKEFVQKHNFLSDNEFKDVVMIANAMPGATMIQLITYIAKKQAGLLGFLISFFVIVFPVPMLLSLVLFYAYSNIDINYITKVSKGILPAVLSMLSIFAFNMLIKDIKNKDNYNFYIYFTIMLCTIIALIVQINIAIIFFAIIVILFCIKLVFK